VILWERLRLCSGPFAALTLERSMLTEFGSTYFGNQFLDLFRCSGFK
jgi:hypothetical protein